MMKNIASSLSLVLALSFAGCAADSGEAPAGAPTIDRAYRVAFVPAPTARKRLELCERDPSCDPADLVPTVPTVYYSEDPDPILGAGVGDQADIAVLENSYLVIDLGPDSCAIDLTQAQLDSGVASCRSVSLLLRALD